MNCLSCRSKISLSPTGISNIRPGILANLHRFWTLLPRALAVREPARSLERKQAGNDCEKKNPSDLEMEREKKQNGQ